MNDSDDLRDLLVEFFQLPPSTPAVDITQAGVAKWDSLAMVQLITELQAAFEVEFELDEIGRLTSYTEIRAALARRNVSL